MHSVYLHDVQWFHIAIALFTVSLPHLYYNVIQSGCEAISGYNYKIARNCLTYMLHFIVIQMSIVSPFPFVICAFMISCNKVRFPSVLSSSRKKTKFLASISVKNCSLGRMSFASNNKRYISRVLLTKRHAPVSTFVLVRADSDVCMT